MANNFGLILHYLTIEIRVTLNDFNHQNSFFSANFLKQVPSQQKYIGPLSAFERHSGITDRQRPKLSHCSSNSNSGKEINIFFF